METVNVINENVFFLGLNVNNVLCLVSIKQEDGEEVAVQYSGNPGYVVGLPLVSGTRTAEYPLPVWMLASLTLIIGTMNSNI